MQLKRVWNFFLSRSIRFVCLRPQIKASKRANERADGRSSASACIRLLKHSCSVRSAFGSSTYTLVEVDGEWSKYVYFLETVCRLIWSEKVFCNSAKIWRYGMTTRSYTFAFSSGVVWFRNWLLFWRDYSKKNTKVREKKSNLRNEHYLTPSWAFWMIPCVMWNLDGYLSTRKKVNF